jgi:hypothetical protein
MSTFGHSIEKPILKYDTGETDIYGVFNGNNIPYLDNYDMRPDQHNTFPTHSYGSQP